MTVSQIYPLELIDETLDINATDNYQLTLELSGEGLSLAVLDLLRGRFVMLRHYPRTDASGERERSWNEIIESDDFLRREFKKVDIIIPSLNATIIPSTVYEPSLRKEYWNLNFGSDDDNNIITNTLSYPDAVVLFTSGKELADEIARRWPGVTPWHHTKPLLSHVSAASRASESCHIHLHCEKEFATVIVIERRSLTFCNSFEVSAPHDHAYFLFSVLDRKGIAHEETVTVSGLVEPYGDEHLALLNFSENIRFATPVIRHSFSYVMNELNLHRWLNLFTAASCV